jgi:hypothetical protein
MMGLASKISDWQRNKVDSRSEWRPLSRRNCLGLPQRESGQSLVPDPPQSMSGMIFVSGIAAKLSSGVGDHAALVGMKIGSINAMFNANLQ